MSPEQTQTTIGVTLADLVTRVRGCDAAAVVGMDGMAIEQRSAGPTPNLDLLSAQHTTLLKAAIASRGEAESGDPSELILLTDRYQFVSRLVARDYFLLLVLEPDASLGRARFEARRVGLLLERELR